jgi:hypothetical protein
MIIQQLINEILYALELLRDLKGRDSLPQHALIKPKKTKKKIKTHEKGEERGKAIRSKKMRRRDMRMKRI